MKLDPFLKLVPSYRDYVWGGDRLRPGHSPTAEAWVVWEQDEIESGSLAGKTLGEAASQFGEALLGVKAMTRTGTRFPLLIKLLDCAQWLSLQVHPNDQQAVELEGPVQFGKTEAWHILDSQPNSRLIAGLKPNTSADMVAASIRNGTIIEHAQYAAVSAGDTIFMPPEPYTRWDLACSFMRSSKPPIGRIESTTGDAHRRRNVRYILRNPFK